MTLRQKPGKRVKKTRYMMYGGPLDLEHLYLETCGTLTFTMKGQTGFYNHNNKWVERP